MNGSRLIHCCLFNARSLVNKIREFHALIYSYVHEMFFVTESWLSSEISSGLIDPLQKYTVIRQDRVSSKSGGVAALISRHFDVVTIELSVDFSMLEVICFDVVCWGNRVRMFVVYRPPYYDTKVQCYIDVLVKCLAKHISRKYANLIVGDFNCPRINWVEYTSSSDNVHSTLLNFVISNGLSQFVHFPTRCENILDLILSTDNQLLNSVSPNPPLGHSDHILVTFTLGLKCLLDCNRLPNADTQHFVWRNADYESIINYLCNVDWYTLVCQNPSAEAVWLVTLGTLWRAIDLYAPKSKKERGVNDNKKHYPREIRKCISKKRQAWRKFRSNSSSFENRQRYHDCANELLVKCRNYTRQTENEVIQSQNLGAFYKYVNRRISYRPKIGVLNDERGNILTDDQDKAELFNRYFASVGVVDDGKIPSCNQPYCEATIDTVEFDERSIVLAINKLKPNLSSGPDGLPPLLFKRIKSSLARPLALLFTQLMSVGFVPPEWKTAIITPVFKKGVAGCVTNYRPISLTCVISKIMERVISKSILEHLSTNQLLSSAQHGFVSKRSTCTNLLESLNDWSLTIQDGHSVTVAYIDFNKAFDSVSHNKLFYCLHLYGIRGDLLLWLKCFFSGRTHRTRIGVSLSSVTNLLSGVVQGSGIGPVAFIIFIDGLVKLLEEYGIKCKVFADDIKVYISVQNVNCTVKLQTVLNIISDWATKSK